MKGMAHLCLIEAPSVRSRTTLCLKQVASGSKASNNKSKSENQNLLFIFPASDGCSTLHMKPEKSARLNQLNAKTLYNWNVTYAQETKHAQICIIPERTAPSPPTITVCLETQVVECNVPSVIAQSVECSAHGSPPQHAHQAHLGFQSLLRGNPIPALRIGQLDLNETWPSWPAVTTTVGFEVKECPLLADNCKLVPSTLGNVPIFLNDNASCLEITCVFLH